MKKYKNRAETLIESLISIGLITIIIIPTLNVLSKSIEANYKINKNTDINIQKQNIIEIIKSLNYENIKNKEGNYKISNIEGLYSLLSVPNEYKQMDIKIENEMSLDIIKTNNYYINNNQNYYIYKIKLDKLEDYYLPHFN